MPEELRPQFDLLKEMLREMDVCLFEQAGIEGDDFLGAVAKKANEKGLSTVILTGDRDSFQLINDKTSVLLTRKGVSESQLYDAAQLLHDYGITPAQVPHLKGLMGDASDNIPGIPGVGEKTALKLIHAYETMDGV